MKPWGIFCVCFIFLRSMKEQTLTKGKEKEDSSDLN